MLAVDHMDAQRDLMRALVVVILHRQIWAPRIQGVPGARLNLQLKQQSVVAVMHEKVHVRRNILGLNNNAAN